MPRLDIMDSAYYHISAVDAYAHQACKISSTLCCAISAVHHTEFTDRRSMQVLTMLTQFV